MAYIVMGYTVLAYVGVACAVTFYTVLIRIASDGLHRYELYSGGVHSYGRCKLVMVHIFMDMARRLHPIQPC